MAEKLIETVENVEGEEVKVIVHEEEKLHWYQKVANKVAAKSDAFTASVSKNKSKIKKGVKIAGAVVGTAAAGIVAVTVKSVIDEANAKIAEAERELESQEDIIDVTPVMEEDSPEPDELTIEEA